MIDKSKEHLMNFVRSKSKFLDLKDGQEAIIKYLSAEPTTTHYQGVSVQCMRYKFEIDGKEVFWDRTSRELAKQMSDYSPGDILLIKVVGQKNQTKYFIEKVR